MELFLEGYGQEVCRIWKAELYCIVTSTTAIFQCEEYSFCEARPYQDKQKNMIGLSTC